MTDPRPGRLRLRHLLETTEAVGEEMEQEGKRFERLRSREASPRVVTAFNLFQTPPRLAASLVERFGRTGRTLEPSAGLGRLYRALRASRDTAVSVSPIVLVEESADCCRELYRETEGDSEATLMQGDFLSKTVETLGTFDFVLMNPPFKMGTDVKHIKHAMTLLKPGGRLVSLCANGPKQRAALQGIATQWEALPQGSFRSEGTGVDVAVFVFDRA